MDRSRLNALRKYVRAADYLSAIQIYLQNNYLLRDTLKPTDIKERLLGHWGTCPGINFVYAHLNRAIIEHHLEMMFILGPGHGFPALQANLFLEGTLSQYDENIPQSLEGIAHMAHQFSWPYGYPSHSNPEAPGVILEGGELGYALATAFGAVLDNPNLIVACLIGDGEAETGPTATAWHSAKLIDPLSNGAVLPIVHLNGYKISGPTIYGRMSNQELERLFLGLGYDPIFVDSYTADDVHQDMAQAIDKAVSAIHDIQRRARKGNEDVQPIWPVILMRTPKGWHSIEELAGKKIEDNHYAHQVIFENPRVNTFERDLLESWLRAYKFTEIFDGQSFDADIKSLVPSPDRAMGNTKYAKGGEAVYKALNTSALDDLEYTATCTLYDAECPEQSAMRLVGMYLRDICIRNQDVRNFRMFSPDETYSNKLDAIFEATTRAFIWPLKDWDNNLSRDGRVIEMLSEHTLQGLMQGYVLTGRHAVLPTYEAFAQIISSMSDQYAKFIKVAREVSWRGAFPSLNYILSSSGWRQEHNGFSHQNPGFIDGILQRQGDFTNVYLPPDANAALVSIDQMMKSEQSINVLVCGKRELPCWRTLDEARADMEAGIAIWDFASDNDPHMVFAACGDYITKETLAAISIIRTYIPNFRVRMVSINHLTPQGVGGYHCSKHIHLDEYFTTDKPVLINFHGYPQTIKQILFDYGYNNKRFTICGYRESGSTTTPFDMMVRNGTDRYHLVMQALKEAWLAQCIAREEYDILRHEFEAKISNFTKYILIHGNDPEEITNWQWHTHL
ncbi:MAG: phosphoketolase family protein [Patescibacteria group bacterium]